MSHSIKLRKRGYRMVIQGIYWDNGKENGNYYLGFRVLDLGFRV